VRNPKRCGVDLGDVRRIATASSRPGRGPGQASIRVDRRPCHFARLAASVSRAGTCPQRPDVSGTSEGKPGEWRAACERPNIDPRVCSAHAFSLTSKHLVKIADLLGIRVQELLGSTEVRLSVEETQILNLFRTLTAIERAMVLRVLHGLRG